MVQSLSSLHLTDSPQRILESTDGAPHACASDKSVSTRVKIWLIEDDRGLAYRRDKRTIQQGVLITLHHIEDGVATPNRSRFVSPNDITSPNACIKAGLGLACEIVGSEKSALLVAGTSYGCSLLFLRQLKEMEARFAVKLRPTTLVELNGRMQALQDILSDVTWRKVSLIHALSDAELPCTVSKFKNVRVAGVLGDLLIAQIGGVTDDVHRGTIFGFTNAYALNDDELLYALSWPRWIRESVRREQRGERLSLASDRETSFQRDDSFELQIQTDLAKVKTLGRPNNSFVKTLPIFDAKPWISHKSLPKRVSMVELFAGVGGMALGFLGAQTKGKTIDLLFSGEVEPIYAQTLKINHRKWNEISGISTLPSNVEATDLASPESFDRIKDATRGKGDISIVVGGPPCQGFSAANRNSWSSDNPNNRLVDVFFKHVEAIMPRVFLMENVQGILWTNSQNTRLSVAHELQQRLENKGYITFPHLLDAAWFGVPQHRFRYFLLGIHEDTGYTRDDFGENGPFPAPTHGPSSPLPFVTVRHAIADLPAIVNGHLNDAVSYRAPEEVNDFLLQMRQFASEDEITDHLTSRHADYVIERYKKIPEGGNWQSIKHLMTNYADIERTHSNIYRRLAWDEPSITMGHYRKSMLIHPSQDRGLSLREAMRLQSFPDWYRFAGNANGKSGGLVHQQQQLANAVCPLLLKAIAGEILKL